MTQTSSEQFNIDSMSHNVLQIKFKGIIKKKVTILFLNSR